MAMIAVALLEGVGPAAPLLAPSCSKMKSNDLLVSLRGGLKSQTLAPHSPTNCKLSTFSLMAIDSAVAVGGSAGPPWRRWCCRLTTKLCPTNIVYVPEIEGVLSQGKTEVMWGRVARKLCEIKKCQRMLSSVKPGGK